MPDTDDSVSLDAFADDGDEDPAALKSPSVSGGQMIALFVSFLIVVSNFFTSSVLSKFGEKAMRGRSLTSWGVVVQGVFLVLVYSAVTYLAEQKVL